MTRPLHEQFEMLINDGAAQTKRHDMEEGEFLTHVSLKFDSAVGVAPIRAFIALETNNQHTVLVGGWVRNQGNTPTDARSLTWDGRIEIAPGMRLMLVGRNDTGGEVTVLCSFITEEA